MERILKKLLPVILFVVLCGCQEKDKTKDIQKACIYKKIDNISGVFMHERGHYTITYANENNKLIMIPIYQLYKTCSCNDLLPSITDDIIRTEEINIFADIPNDKVMWAETEFNGKCSLNIHIHSAKNIEGAGWRHGNGKHRDTYGSTTVIEAN
jgi:hypothetical protein